MDGPSPRIVKETKTIANEPVEGIICSPDPNNYKHFFVIINGNYGIKLRTQGYMLWGGQFQRLSPPPRRLPNDSTQSCILYQDLSS